MDGRTDLKIEKATREASSAASYVVVVICCGTSQLCKGASVWVTAKILPTVSARCRSGVKTSLHVALPWGYRCRRVNGVAGTPRSQRKHPCAHKPHCGESSESI